MPRRRTLTGRIERQKDRDRRISTRCDVGKKKMCCVMGCPLKQSRAREVLYLYPPTRTQRYIRWLTLFPNSFILHSNKDNYICRRHFTAESFDGKLLKHSADPTINIDTSYAQDQILRTFLIKVVYEWSLRASVNDCDLIAKKALEARDLLGMPNFNADKSWVSKFIQIRETNVQNGIRFGNETGSIYILDIIKDLRSYLPSNFSLPIDLLNITSEGDQLEVKNECDSEDEDGIQLSSGQISNFIENTELSKKTDRAMKVEAEPEKALSTYQEALDLLKPLEAYITSIGNQNALVRLQEVETVVKQVVESENKPKRANERNRSSLLQN